MQKSDFETCFKNSKLILTEGAIGLRLEREYHIKPDKDIMYASLIYDEHARKALETIYRQYLEIAQDHALPIMLMTNTRRANRERVARSVLNSKDIMGDYTNFLFGLVSQFRCQAYVGGMMGCKGDAYKGDEGISTEEALEFHSWQADAFRAAKPDFLFAGIMPCLPEAIGMAKAMEAIGLPYIISLMLGRDGRLLDGHWLHDAIQAIDEATQKKPLCYMSNCIHPAILKEALSQPKNRTSLVQERFCGIQANASCLDPCQLDNIGDLKTSDAKELASHILSLHQ